MNPHVTVHLESQLGKCSRQHVCSVGETSKIAVWVPVYNPSTQTDIIINLWPNCKPGFMLMLFVLSCKTWNIVKPGAWLARPPPGAQQSQNSSPILSVIQSLNHVWLFVTPWTVACQASLSFTISRSLLKLMPIELVMPSNNLILCRPLLLLPSIFPSIRVFPNESALRIRWPKYGSFSFNISPSSEYSGLISFRIDWFDLHKSCIHSRQSLPVRAVSRQVISKIRGLLCFVPEA